MQAIRQTVNRAKEVIDEKFGDPTTTPYDIETQKIIKLAEDIKNHGDLMSAMHVYSQPDPALRMLPTMMSDGLNKPEQLAKEMGELGRQLSNTTPYGNTLLACADAYNTIGRAHREFLTAIQTSYFLPMKRLLHEDIKPVEKEADKLATRRLELDAVKNNIKGHHGYVVPPELEKAQRNFDEQQEKVKMAGRCLEKHVEEMRNALRSYVEQQERFFCIAQKSLANVHL